MRSKTMRIMSYNKFVRISPFLNLSQLSLQIGQHRLYLSDVVHGRNPWRREIGRRIQRVLGVRV